MHRNFKRKSVSAVAGYCPLDLYSGDKGRILHALKSLLDYPDNNLRVFLDGRHLELNVSRF
jgi:inositol-pentakisphosphate 2-kinase